MSGWHSINPRNADTTRFGAYILSVEDELRKPVFFIFTPEEFQALLDSKKADSKGLRHFYISRAEAGMDRFVDWRDGGMDMNPIPGRVQQTRIQRLTACGKKTGAATCPW